MRKKFTMLLAVLLCCVGVAKADFTISYKKLTGFWGNATTEYPTEITNLITENTISSAEVHCLTKDVVVETSGNITVVFQHVDGDHKQHLLGVVLKNADGVVKADYHYGTTPGTNNTYTLSDVEAGEYTLSMYVTRNGGDQPNHFGGTIAITGANEPVLITLTTNPDEPVLYTIKNTRSNNYAYYDGASKQMLQSNTINSIAHLFFFMAGSEEGTYKIHNYVTSKTCNDHNSWTDAGRDWYILAQNGGLVISKELSLTDSWESTQAWNDWNNKKVTSYAGIDGGSTWSIEEFVDGVESLDIKMSTATEKYLYFIRNDKANTNGAGKYANFVGEGSQFTLTDNYSYDSYWYFVADEAAQTAAPEGTVACRIYNAAHNSAVVNPASGEMSEDDAKIFYIKPHENGYWGYAIYNKDNEDEGWNNADGGGQNIAYYNYNDEGSIWSLIPANKTGTQLMNEATTAKNNALSAITRYEEADYYTYADADIATARAAVEAIDVTALPSAVISLKESTAATAMNTLTATTKGTEGPKAGDFIRLKNREGRGYMKNDLEGDYKEKILGTSSANEIASNVTLWAVEDAGDGSANVKLRNVATNRYLGQLRNNTQAKVTDVNGGTQDNTGHNKFAFTNQTDCYAVFKDVSGGDGAYGHMGNNNPKILIGYNTSDPATHWIVSKAYPITVVYKYKDAELDDHKVETYVDANQTYTINNPYAGTNKYIGIGECIAEGNSQLVNTDGTWSVKVTEATTIIVTLVDDLPFKVSESYANATWYYMNIRSDNKKYVAMSDATEYSNVAKPAADDKSLWAFMGDADGIKLINKAAGEGKTLSFEGEATGDKAVVMREEVKTWTIERAATGFLLRAGNTGNLYVHDLGGKLKIWNSTSAPTDKGSAFNVVEDKGVKSLEELALNPRYMNVYTIQAERSPLLYDANAEHPTKLSSGMVRGIAANENDINQQFLILRTPSTPEGYFYLYNLGAEKFVDEKLNFIDFPSPVLSLVASGHAAYPWRVKIDDKFVIPGGGGTDGNKIHHTAGGDDDDGKRYRIIKVGEYDDFGRFTTIEEAEDMIKATSELSNEKVYTVSTVNGGYWYYKSEQNALWSTGKAGVEFSAQDPAQQIAFLTVSGHTYLYSIGAQKFVVKAGDNTAYSNVPSQSIELLDAEGSRFYPFVAAFVDGDNRHHIGISNDYDIPVITNRNSLNDNGNKIKLREVTPGYMAEGAADLLAAAVTQIDNYLAAQELKPELATKIAEVQALLDKNYLDTEDTDVLTTAKATAQTVHDKAGATSAELTEQINLLTEAIAAVTYVTEITEFKNCYLYTFVSKRGWMVATDANTVKSADEGAANNPLHQWAVYKSANNNYYLYNIGKQQFMGFVNTDGAMIPFAETPQMTTLTFKKSNWADYPIMFSVDNVGAVNNDTHGDMKYWDGGSNDGWNNLQDDGNNHKVTIVGAVPSETLTAIESRVATHELDVAIAAVQAKVDVMNKLGYYSSSNENIEADFNAIKDFKDAINAETTVDAINAQTTAANNLVATFTALNVPQAGKFYRFKHPSEDAYMLSHTTTVNGNKRLAMGALNGNEVASIFYHDGNTLLSYAIGQHASSAPKNSTTDWTCLAVGAEAPVVTYGAGTVLGTLGFYLGADNTRAYYSGRETYVDAGGSIAANEGYDWEVVEVTTLPVTVTTAGWATLYAPVALTIPGGVEAVYTGTVVDNYLDLTAIEGGTIPANTGVVIKANAGTYNFTIAADVDEITDNDLTGKYPKSAKNDGAKVYTLQNGDNGVGFYLFKGQDANGVTTYINGFRAWVELEEASAPANALRIRFAGTTGIENSTLNHHPSTEVYDLQGRRVLNPTKGMYIVNGKKMVIK